MKKKKSKTDKFEISRGDQKRADAILDELRKLRRRQALNQNWVRRWSRKIGPLANVLPPEWKQEGGRV